MTILLINCFIGWHTTTAYFLRFNDGAVILMGFVLMVDSNPNPNLSLCHHRCPLVFNKTEQRRKKNAENTLRFDDFTVYFTHLFFN